jgi:drug/metabolite transporter (DMT)-like permease
MRLSDRLSTTPFPAQAEFMVSSNELPDKSAGAARAFPAWLKSPVIALIFTTFCWACTTIVVRHTRMEIPPFGLAFWRNFSATLFILPFAIEPLRRQWPLIRAHLPLLALLSALLWLGGNALLFLALQYTIAINAGVINSVEPVLIILAAAILFRDRISWLQAAGVAVSLSGVLVLLSAGSFERLLQLKLNIGDLIVFCAYIFWALYAVLLRKLPRGMDPWAMLFVLIGLGALFVMPLYLLETIYFRAMPFTLTSVASSLWLGLFPCAICMYLWNYAISSLGASRAGQFLHLIPAFTVILAILLLGEQFAGHHLAGIALIIAGIALTSRS